MAADRVGRYADEGTGSTTNDMMSVQNDLREVISIAPNVVSGTPVFKMPECPSAPHRASRGR